MLLLRRATSSTWRTNWHACKCCSLSLFIYLLFQWSKIQSMWLLNNLLHFRCSFILTLSLKQILKWMVSTTWSYPIHFLRFLKSKRESVFIKNLKRDSHWNKTLGWRYHTINVFEGERQQGNTTECQLFWGLVPFPLSFNSFHFGLFLYNWLITSAMHIN